MREIFDILTTHTKCHLPGGRIVGVLSSVLVTQKLSMRCALLIHISVVPVQELLSVALFLDKSSR